MLGRRRWGALGVALAFALVAACSGGDDDDEADGDKAESTSDRGDGREPTPLDKWWESVGSSGEDVPDDEMREENRRVEAQITECMQTQGFDYIPMEMPDMASIEDMEDEGPWNLPPDEFAEQYGYGMFTMDELEPSEEEEDLFEDPNQAALDSMSESERAAYEEALWGEFDEETGETITEGCSGEAWAAESGEDPFDDEEFAGLFEEMDALWERINSDSRVEEATREWADCMADAGYADLSSPEDAQTVVQERYDELAPGDEAPSDESLYSDVAGDGLIVEGDPSEIDPDDMRALRDYEIEVAVADFTCQDGKYADVLYDVQVELEEQFIDEHREELERYRDALASSPGVG